GDVSMHDDLKAQFAKQDLSRLRLSSVLLKKLQIDNAVLEHHHRSHIFPKMQTCYCEKTRQTQQNLNRANTKHNRTLNLI
ncbi:hypothetical protein VIGAN_04150400, partial [Vigna angularis var. angularis]